MKLILVFAFLTFAYLARAAPPPSSTSRVLILPDYHGFDSEESHEKDIHAPLDEEEDDEYIEISTIATTTTTTTTTPKTTRRFFVFPTRNRDLIPTRRSTLISRIETTPMLTTAASDDNEAADEYDGDFKYIRDFQKYVQRLFEEMKKLFRNVFSRDFDVAVEQEDKNNDD